MSTALKKNRNRTTESELRAELYQALDNWCEIEGKTKKRVVEELNFSNA